MFLLVVSCLCLSLFSSFILLPGILTEVFVGALTQVLTGVLTAGPRPQQIDQITEIP